MAQSDKIGRTALGLEPFWDKPSSNPPISWEKWRSQLKMALVAKTNIELDELLQERPTAVIYPPPEPVEEQPIQNPTQTLERERMTRYNQAMAKWKNERNHIDRIGVLCGDKPWDMADRKAKSLIYLSLGIEGQNMHARKFPHTNVEAKTTMERWDELEQTFTRPRNVTFDRYLLVTRKQQRGETMEQFHSALRSLAEHCQLGYLEDALLEDRFNNGFYGLTDMPAEFKKAIDKTLYNLTNTFSFLDDIIIVTIGGLQNHKEKLFKCLDRLNAENLAINLNKCHFAKNKITWLGYEIDQKGIKPIVSKTQAIQNLKPPTSNKQLKSFLGSVHHRTKFIPNLAPICREFKTLLQKDTKYIWTNHHQRQFENIKECIRNLTENTHYDTKRKTRVKTDASRSVLGAVLEQETCDGWETISYASRFVNKAEEKYSFFSN